MIEWLKIAAEQGVVRRALKYAMVVGAVLITINHGDAIVLGNITTARLLKMGLTVMVPYIVSTSSCVGTICEMRAAAAERER